MKKLLISSALAGMLSVNAHAAAQFSANDTFTASLTFAQLIDISVADLTLTDVIPGDIIDREMAITLTKTGNRAATCTLDTADLAFNSTTPGTTDIDTFTLTNGASLSTTAGDTSESECSTLYVDGTIPSGASSPDNDGVYTADVVISVSYDNTTHVNP